MYPQRMVMQTLRLGLLVTLVVLAVSACGGVEEYGPIVFGRHFAGERSDLTYSAIFAMNPDGSHVSQITHPPRGLSRRLSGVVRRRAEARLLSPSNRREH
jgi:hypothetical protein